MGFTTIAKFTNRLEAETVAHALDEHDIAFIIKSDHSEVLPLVESSMDHAMVELCVDEELAERAKEVLSGLIDSSEEE